MANDHPEAEGPTDRHTSDRPASQQSAQPSAVGTPPVLEMPGPTAWPMALALGITLAASGFVTNYAFSAAGIILLAIALGGWIHQLLPGAGQEEVPLRPLDQRAGPIRPDLRPVAAERLGVTRHRARFPEMVPSYAAGVAGGTAGSVAMAAVALFYGLISRHGIWYPVNLLGGMLIPGTGQMTIPQLEQFNLGMLLLGLLIHGVTSVCVGLFFASILPMLPGRPIVWGGVVGPLMWTGGIYAFMNVLNPVMADYVDWVWFIVSQFAFGLAAGYVVQRFEQVKTPQTRT
jgi:hypothetical protein